jgi:hypothetical protein
LSGRLRPLPALALCTATLALGLAAPPAPAAGPSGVLDARAWELVSPAPKNGGEVGAPASEAAGVLQAAAGGGAIAYGSVSSFGEAGGAAPVNQYLARRGPGAWASENLTPALLSGTYAAGAYQLFSTDLSRAILANGWSCRAGEVKCAAANPPLGPGAPPGYRNLYLREGATYTPLITSVNSPALVLGAEDFALSLAGADPELRYPVLSTCAALTAVASEVPGAEGCDPAAQNLYQWSAGTLSLVNLLPGQSEGTPGATLAAPAGAIAADGSRVYFSAEPAPGERNLYLREGAESVQVDGAQGGGGAFQTATADGSLAFFTKAGHLYRYSTASGEASDLTPGGEVQGVLAASADGAYLYYLSVDGLYLDHGGLATKIAAAADAANYPPATGLARLSADGTRLAFLSSASLTAYPSAGKAELYLYDASAGAGAGQLLCASCNPKGTAPLGPATIPAPLAIAAGPPAYKPRALSADGTRLFFTSPDALLPGDTDNRADAYQWQAPGTGGCALAKGCLGLISGGRAGAGTFADASASGQDAFFTTATALLPLDTGPDDTDLYNARAGGGFPEATPPVPCNGDACQGPPPAPDDPAPGSATFLGAANPPPRYVKEGKRHHHKKKHHHKHHQHSRGGRR